MIYKLAFHRLIVNQKQAVILMGNVAYANKGISLMQITYVFYQKIVKREHQVILTENAAYVMRDTLL